MTLPGLLHSRQELPHHPEVRNSTNLEDPFDQLFWSAENTAYSADAGVVNEDGGVAVLSAEGPGCV